MSTPCIKLNCFPVFETVFQIIVWNNSNSYNPNSFPRAHIMAQPTSPHHRSLCPSPAVFQPFWSLCSLDKPVISHLSAPPLPGTSFPRLLCGSFFRSLGFAMDRSLISPSKIGPVTPIYSLFHLVSLYFLHRVMSFWDFLIHYSCLSIVLLYYKHYMCCLHVSGTGLPSINMHWMSEWMNEYSQDDKTWVNLRDWRMRIFLK